MEVPPPNNCRFDASIASASSFTVTSSLTRVQLTVCTCSSGPVHCIMVTAIDCVISERIEFKTCRISKCRCVALLLQFETIIAHATGSINREHERECNFRLDRLWRLWLLLFLGPDPEQRRGDC